jgi:undecaprenyl pyrophosphate synthase
MDTVTGVKELSEYSKVWPPKSKMSRGLQGLLTKILRQGRITGHVSMIMDGNRRWARKNNLLVAEGHF